MRARGQATEDGFYYLEAGVELPSTSVDEFAEEVEALLTVALRARLVDKVRARARHAPVHATPYRDAVPRRRTAAALPRRPTVTP